MPEGSRECSCRSSLLRYVTWNCSSNRTEFREHHTTPASGVGTDWGPGAEAKGANIVLAPSCDNSLSVLAVIRRSVVVREKEASSSCLPTRATVPVRMVLPVSLNMADYITWEMISFSSRQRYSIFLTRLVQLPLLSKHTHCPTLNNITFSP